MTAIVLGTLLFGYGALAPGLALAWVLLRDPDPVVLIATGALLGVFAVPMLHFGAAMALGSNMSVGSTVMIATLILLGCGAWEVWGRPQSG